MDKRSSLLLVAFSLLMLAGCAASREATAPSNEYVEIDNPAFTMSPGAPPTIWVPRSDLEGSVPRGGELIQKGYDSIRGDGAASGGSRPAAQAAPPSAAAATAPASERPVAPCRVKNRIFTMETGRSGLLARFNEELAKVSGDLVIDPAKASMVSRYASVATTSDRSALAVKLQEDFGANLVIFISVPDGMVAGGLISAELYEGFGGTLVRRMQAQLPPFAAGDAGARNAALSTTLARLASDVRSVSALLTWYGRVVSVDGDRVYVNAGRESGLPKGSVLNLYRGGKAVERLGFAPGPKLGVLEIEGFVGTDGAFGTVKGGVAVQSSDLVGFQ